MGTSQVVIIDDDGEEHSLDAEIVRAFYLAHMVYAYEYALVDALEWWHDGAPDDFEPDYVDSLHWAGVNALKQPLWC